MRARRTSGFTLIEVMMVVAILGLTLTMGLPSFVKTIKREGMRKVQMDLMEACRTARRSAILSSEPVYITFHPRDGDFETSGFHSQWPEDIHLEMLAVNFLEYKDAESARVRFNPNGTSDEFTIVVHSDQGDIVKLSLEPITALARMENLR